MTTIAGLEALAKSLAPVITAAVERSAAELRAQIAERDARIDALEKALADRPVPLDGRDGVDGQAGKDGASVTADDVLPAIKEHADAFLRSLPTPQNGRDGRDGVDGAAGRDGTGPSVDEVAATFERRFSDLTLSWERQVRETTEKAIDRMPAPKDGRDALPLESFELELDDDGRTVTVKMQTGETVLSKSVRIPAVLDRGVFSAERADKGYECGDGVTYGGCFWLAKKDAPEGVPGGSDDWRLAVKRGRDGKDLRDSASTHDTSKGVKIK